MDPKALKHDRGLAKILTRQGASVVVTQDAKLYIPLRFSEVGLANVGDTIMVAGCAGLVSGDRYAVINAPAMLTIVPRQVSVVNIEGDDYYEFSFEKGDTLIERTQVEKSSAIVTRIFTEVLATAHVPWYIGYEHLGKLLYLCKYHGGIDLMPTNAIVEVVTAATTRLKKDRRLYLRHHINSIEEANESDPAFIGLRNVIYGATNTTARLMGSYFESALTSALVNPSERLEGVEDLLRR